jgi:hypothetical protein
LLARTGCGGDLGQRHHADRGGRGSAGVIAGAAAVALERDHHDRHFVACLG